MEKHLAALLFMLTLYFSGIAVLPAGEVAASGARKVDVKLMQKESLGRFLAAGNGMTLYRFTRDEKDASNCLEGCAVNWPPFYAGPSAVIEGCEPSDFRTITRSDGRKQTTYKGMPLYYFKNDKYPGDTFGAGIGGKWFPVIP